MSKALLIFEDDYYQNFFPLTILRPTYFLRPGIRRQFEVISDSFKQYHANLCCRHDISKLVAEQTNMPVNSPDLAKADEVIMVNGCLRADQNFFAALINANSNVVIISKERLVGAKIFGGLTADEAMALRSIDINGLVSALRTRSETMEIEIRLYGYLWDIVDDIHSALSADIKALRQSPQFKETNVTGSSKDISMAFPGAVFINSGDIIISRDARILPGAVLDASNGPIYIDSETYIEPHTYLIGPAYVGRKSRLVGGKMTGCSIGPVCRVGGEVEETIIQGYTNKYHAGFLGHAYVGEWVNFGAMTTNSDLRNDYKNVKVSINRQIIDTGKLKVGSFIGDFTKTAIGTLLNTGINIGIACNILGDGLVAEKEIPSFTWYAAGRKHEYKAAKALETIAKTMSRRQMILSRELTDCLNGVFNSRNENE